jgi:ribosomal protein S18 acetylase RimI-like enzyme
VSGGADADGSASRPGDASASSEVRAEQAHPTRILRGAGMAARVRPWPGTRDVAHVVALDQQGPPPVALLRSWLNDLRTEGYTSVRTGATAPTHRGPYDALGFTTIQQLALLRARLSEVAHRPRRASAEPEVRLRRARAGELVVLAAIDRAAFPAGWSLDAAAIAEAAGATPSQLVRVARTRHGTAVGYAVSGRAGRASFLQRLAVRPDAQGRGVGMALVDDAMRWARRRRSTTMVVNTQHDNDAALSLYRRAGFQLLREELVVLERSLDAPL